MSILRTFPLPLAALLFAACSEVKPPNVVLVTLDTTRVDYLGVYGATEAKTPHMDELAKRGARFDLALSSSAVTPVSHATILTGLFPYEHGLRVLSADGGDRLSESIPTLATTLRARGYETIAVHSAFPVSAHFGFDNGFDTFDSLDIEMERHGLVNDRWNVSSGQRRSDKTTNLALELLEDVDGPFFLWIHYWDPHDPILLPPKKFLPESFVVNRENIAGRHAEVYSAEIQFVDYQFGRLLTGLSSLGHLEQTLVCLTSDHGEGLDDGLARHGWWAHRILYQEQIHVPLLVAGPGIPGGVTSSALVRTADIAPTIYDYIDIPPPMTLSGASLRPLIEGLPDPPRVAYADQINGFDYNASMVNQRPQASFLYSVARDGWKLIYRPVDPSTSELYDLSVDPLEEHDLFTQERAIAQDLMRDLASRSPWVLEPFQATDGNGSSADAQALLEALGYAGGSALEEGVWDWYSISTGEIRQHPGDPDDPGWLPVLRPRDS